MLEPERTLSLTAARQRIENQIHALSLKTYSHWQGNALGVARVGLDGPAGQNSMGCGKGYREQAQVGALYEALEHYLDNHAERRYRLREADTLRQSPYLHSDLLYPWLIEQPAAQHVCQAYLDYSGQWLFDYPIHLTAPDFKHPPTQQSDINHTGLRRYSNNAGSAIGASRDEAILHALNQRIERDALSLFLLRHYYYQCPSPVAWVDKPDESTSLGKCWRRAELTLQSPIQVLDISNEFVSHTFLALRMDDLSKPHGALFGTGASLDPWHAAHRAVTELVQLQINGSEPELVAEQQLAERQLHPFPALQRCLQLSLQPLIAAPKTVRVLPPATPQASVGDQVRLLLADLRQKGHTVGICEVFNGHQGICLVNVVIPGLEAFHVVTSGNVVCPSQRGVALAAAWRAGSGNE